MTSKSASILANPGPQSHIVFPCADEGLIAQAAALFLAGGLANEESVVLITTPAHGDAIERLLERDFDIVDLKSKGQLIALDAERQLAKLLVDQMPDAGIFETTVKNLITTAKHNSRVGRVRVFAEMVSLLWKINLEATVRLEEFWNNAIEVYSVPVLCSYSMNGSGACAHRHLPESLLAQHSETVTASDSGAPTWSSVVQNSAARESGA
jgi:hypothetical protein